MISPEISRARLTTNVPRRCPERFRLGEFAPVLKKAAPPPDFSMNAN
jgi:hypothetical protein